MGLAGITLRRDAASTLRRAATIAIAAAFARGDRQQQRGEPGESREGVRCEGVRCEGVRREGVRCEGVRCEGVRA